MLIAQGAIAAPNLLLIVADDLGSGELGCQGNTEIPTPHIDSIARDGVRFTQGYVTAPVCAPSRAGMLAGRYQRRFGWNINVMPHVAGGSEHGIPTSEYLLSEMLQKHGYQTAAIGKWHLGARDDFHPLEHGFDQFFGYAHEGHFFVPPPHDGVVTLLRQAPLPDGATGRIKVNDRLYLHDILRNEPLYDLHNPVLDGREEVSEFEYLTDRFTSEALDFLDHAATTEAPFFLYLSHSAVHSPLQGADAYMEKFAHIEDIHRRIFAAMLANLDDSTGAVLAKLEEHDLTKDTLVVFLSDNGGPTRELTSSNGIYRDEKGNLYEGGIRVPMLMRWPEVLPVGTVYDKPTLSLDIYATMAEAVGDQEALDRTDGVNLLPFLAGSKRDEVPHPTLYWQLNQLAAIRVDEWKAVRPRNRAVKGMKPLAWELYKLDDDPSESRNLAEAQPERLSALIEQWQSTSADWDAEAKENPSPNSP